MEPEVAEEHSSGEGTRAEPDTDQPSGVTPGRGLIGCRPVTELPPKDPELPTAGPREWALGWAGAKRGTCPAESGQVEGWPAREPGGETGVGRGPCCKVEGHLARSKAGGERSAGRPRRQLNRPDIHDGREGEGAGNRSRLLWKR